MKHLIIFSFLIAGIIWAFSSFNNVSETEKRTSLIVLNGLTKTFFKNSDINYEALVDKASDESTKNVYEYKSDLSFSEKANLADGTNAFEYEGIINRYANIFIYMPIIFIVLFTVLKRLRIMFLLLLIVIIFNLLSFISSIKLVCLLILGYLCIRLTISIIKDSKFKHLRTDI